MWNRIIRLLNVWTISPVNLSGPGDFSLGKFLVILPVFLIKRALWVCISPGDCYFVYFADSIHFIKVVRWVVKKLSVVSYYLFFSLFCGFAFYF